jgi:hypothetical protein
MNTGCVVGNPYLGIISGLPVIGPGRQINPYRSERFGKLLARQQRFRRTTFSSTHGSSNSRIQASASQSSNSWGDQPRCSTSSR